MSDYVLWHEMLHSSSVSYYSEQDYKNNRIIEEGSVELLTREICLRKGIKIGDGYDDIVKTLYILCGFLEYPSRMEFARDLFNVPLPERYDWLEDRVRDKMIKDKFSIDQIEQGVQFLSIKFQGKML